MRARGLEPPRVLPHQNLNLARLPISPRPLRGAEVDMIREKAFHQHALLHMNFASSTLMPLLARIVIASAMLTSGWLNCFGQVQIRAEIVDGLRAMDIEVNEPILESEEPPITDKVEEGEESAEASAKKTTSVATKPTTRGVNRIVWLIHNKWPDLGGWGTFISWFAAVAQLAAGVMLLVGLFTRLAALTICTATGMAIYMVSVNAHGMLLMNPFDWPLDSHRFIQLYAGLGLFTLSLGLLIGGAGVFSIDYRHRKVDTLPKNKTTKNSNE